MRKRVRAVFRAIGWPFRKALMTLLIGYRTLVSPLLGPRCRYYPSCSAYGLQAIQAHGAAKGSALICWRLLRCNPFSKGGYDPVPAPGRWLPDEYPDGKPRHHDRAAHQQRPSTPMSPKEA